MTGSLSPSFALFGAQTLTVKQSAPHKHSLRTILQTSKSIHTLTSLLPRINQKPLQKLRVHRLLPTSILNTRRPKPRPVDDTRNRGFGDGWPPSEFSNWRLGVGDVAEEVDAGGVGPGRSADCEGGCVDDGCRIRAVRRGGRSI